MKVCIEAQYKKEEDAAQQYEELQAQGIETTVNASTLFIQIPKERSVEVLKQLSNTKSLIFTTKSD